MNSSGTFKRHHRPAVSVSETLAVAEDEVTVLGAYASHPRSRQAQSPPPFSKEPRYQQFPAAAPGQNAARRVGPGAGATPVFVAAIRHDTSLARMGSLVGRSRTCPSSFVANPNAFRIPNEFISKE
jgi:hypothetical protein